MRRYKTFSWRDASFRIASDRFEVVTACIREQRANLEDYISGYPLFHTSMIPILPVADAPDVALRMHRAAYTVGVGPMAAVAGTMAQLAVEAAVDAGAEEAIVENGGDIYLLSPRPVTIGLYAGGSRIGSQLALSVTPADMPLAICSSSSIMGHSHSLGHCNLATVVSRDGSLADAAATQACNQVQDADDLEPTSRHIAAIHGILGVLLVKDDLAAMAGRLPELVRHNDPHAEWKITRHRSLARVHWP